MSTSWLFQVDLKTAEKGKASPDWSLSMHYSDLSRRSPRAPWQYDGTSQDPPKHAISFEVNTFKSGRTFYHFTKSTRDMTS